MSTTRASRSASVFAAELRRAMTARNVTTKSLARAVGISQRQASFWTLGKSLPFIRTAQLASEALDWPRLVVLVRDARTIHCHNCDRLMVSEGAGSTVRYCGSDCRTIARKKGTPFVNPGPVARQLTLYREAVTAMCLDCEPEGLCRFAECGLRSVSPLPLGARAEAEPVKVGRGSRWDHPEQREAFGALARARWADPEFRERMSRKLSEVHAAKTAEELSEWRLRVGQGARRASRARRAVA